MNQADPIWGVIPQSIEARDDGLDVTCARSGGSYRIALSALPALSRLGVAEKARLTSWILNQNRLGSAEPPLVGSYTIDAIDAMRPLSVAEQMDQLLAYLDSRKIRPQHWLPWLVGHTSTPETRRSIEEAAAWTEAWAEDEVPAFGQLLIGEGLLRNIGGNVNVSAAGFARMAALRNGGVTRTQAFVAMWFDKSVEAIYHDGIMPTVTDLGYSCLRIDQKEHVNKIDDEIVAEIRRSKFVIADFTAQSVTSPDGEQHHIPRGGVYYEAGFAHGLGIPVIWLIRADQIAQTHFDIRQFNFIAWTDVADLKIRLRNRIRALFPEAD